MIDNRFQLNYNRYSLEKELMILFLAIMDWVIPIAAGLLIGLVFAMRKNIDVTQIVVLDTEEFRLTMRKGQLIDLRKEEDYHKKHVSGAKNFPKRSIFQNLSKLRADQAIFLISYSHKGSVYSISKKLLKKGFHRVYILKDGLKNWNYPLKEE